MGLDGFAGLGWGEAKMLTEEGDLVALCIKTADSNIAKGGGGVFLAALSVEALEIKWPMGKGARDVGWVPADSLAKREGKLLKIGGGEVEAPRTTIVGREAGEELLETFEEHGGARARASGRGGSIRVKGDGFEGLKGTTNGVSRVDGDYTNITLTVVDNEKFKEHTLAEARDAGDTCSCVINNNGLACGRVLKRNSKGSGGGEDGVEGALIGKEIGGARVRVLGERSACKEGSWGRRDSSGGGGRRGDGNRSGGS